mmetsp:Transcript_88555/g.251014  ORF Transcript_88555/g.251014 Transcript_88555/m.251014 type:complete len:226 (+) Transcript_88555:647-1324(+)
MQASEAEPRSTSSIPPSKEPMSARVRSTSMVRESCWMLFRRMEHVISVGLSPCSCILSTRAQAASASLLTVASMSLWRATLFGVCPLSSILPRVSRARPRSPACRQAFSMAPWTVSSASPAATASDRRRPASGSSPAALQAVMSRAYMGAVFFGTARRICRASTVRCSLRAHLSTATVLASSAPASSRAATSGLPASTAALEMIQDTSALSQILLEMSGLLQCAS